ncbi:hypothetical protein Ancab_036768 [Ancistrocladus abbreviatus]
MADDSETSTATVDEISDLLPLQLIKSESVPPAPNTSETGSTIDWLPDFAGYSWIAYGASSLLVISHLPSPLSPHETNMGPIFRQVLDLPARNSSEVSAVSWSPSIPSAGDLAAAADNSIFLFAYNSAEGSFCWRQIALLLQSAKVEAIKWTDSGDGIVTGGIEVVLWKRNARSWEIAWKFGVKQAQSLVSASWSIDGPAASAAHPSKLHCEGSIPATDSARKCVTVIQSSGKSGYVISELQHPRPVSMIQWRPLGGRHVRYSVYVPRHILLTCCLDGTVRLWSEIDDDRVRKRNKDIDDPKSLQRNFYVVSVIDDVGNGTLGKSVFISWAVELNGIVCTHKGTCQCFPTAAYQHNKVGRCEWLIGLGPGPLVTLWAVHCLDDVAPVRPPRVTLWKRIEILGSAVKSFSDSCIDNPLKTSGLNKATMFRNRLFGPPFICSLIQTQPCSSLGWSLLHTQMSVPEDISSDKPESETAVHLSHDSTGILNIGGHTGKVLKISVLPRRCGGELAVSLDSSGLLLFWSISTSSNCASGLPTLNPSWKILGELAIEEMSPHFASLTWAPSWWDEDHILLIGRSHGIDGFVVKTHESEEEKILCHKLCTIPFIDCGLAHGPDKLFSVPLRPPSKNFNHFMLIGIWSKAFQALSWKLALHSSDFSGSCCECQSDARNDGSWIFQSEFAGKTYCIVVNPCSGYLPDSDVCHLVTSVDVVCPSILMPSLQQIQDPVNDFCPSYFAYHMATGHFDGRLRLWRSNLSKLSVSFTPWELVGIFTAHQGPVTAISLADFGQKIATMCSAGPSDSVDMVYVWEPVHLKGVGCFALEGTISLSGCVIALNWLSMGTGQLCLGVCLQYELHIYARRRCSGQTMLNVGKPSEESTWFCISIAHSLSAVSSFLWGPRATVILVHEKYFTVFSQWAFLMNKKHMFDGHITKNGSVYFTSKMDEGMLSAVSLDCEVRNLDKLSLEEGSKLCDQRSTSMMGKNCGSNGLFVGGFEPDIVLNAKIGPLSILELAEELCGSLSFYHPEVLLLNILSGNWKRAFLALQHVVESLGSAPAAEERTTSAELSRDITQIKLSNYFEGHISTRGIIEGFQWTRNDGSVNLSSFLEVGPRHFGNNLASEACNNNFGASTSSESGVFLEIVEKLHTLAAITDSQKIQIFAIVDLLREISNSQSTSAYESLDAPGRRFWCSVRLQQLDFSRRYGRMPSTEELIVDSRLIAWAFHSDSQENLFNAFFVTEASWNEMRNMGVGFWFTNAAQLRQKMEKLARFQYLKNKDPKACALLYIALNRIQVLAGLFKISKDEKDKPLVGFLSHNFQEEKHRAAALKNAYVLMGRHQHELAIAFFLLGGDTISAVTVCAKTLGDEQLALVLCRLLEGQGGPLEHHLLSKIILPSAIEKGDYWLASVLQWVLGNYCQSFLIMLGFQVDFHISGSAHSFKHAAFFDPSIGQYCQTLASKNSLKNAAGEQDAAILYKWAILMTASALNKSGLPLEALECLSSSSNILKDADQGRDRGNSETLPQILKPSSADSSNWVSGEVASLLENHVKSDFAMQYISKLIQEHPSWPSTRPFNKQSAYFKEYDFCHYGTLLESFQERFNFTLAYVEQKFSLIPDLLLNKMLVSFFNNGLFLLGYDILCGFACQDHLLTMSSTFSFLSDPDLLKQLLDAIKELSYLVSRFVAACSLSSLQTSTSSTDYGTHPTKTSGCFSGLGFYVLGLLLSMCYIKAALMTLYGNSTKELITLSFVIIDLCTYCVYLASADLQRNLKALSLMVPPLLGLSTDGHPQTPMSNLGETLSKISELMGYKSLVNARYRDLRSAEWICHEQGRSPLSTTPEDDKWKVVEVCLWQHVSRFMMNELNQLSDKLGKFRYSSTSSNPGEESSPSAATVCPLPVVKRALEYVPLACINLAESIVKTVGHVSSFHAKQLAVFLMQKVEDGMPVPTLIWLEEFSQSQPRGCHEHLNGSQDGLGVVNTETLSLHSELFSNLCDPALIKQVLAQTGIGPSELVQWKPFKGWSGLYMGITGEHEKVETYVRESVDGRSSDGDILSPATAQSYDGHNVVEDRKEPALCSSVVPFLSPKEIYKRNGELIEALCINSLDQRQAALASNRKGIVFFDWDDGLSYRDESEYIWSEADWPRNGWAGAESTPVPTCVSPGVGLGEKKGSHLGLGGATVGVGSLVKPGRDLTGGGAFGIPGYAGIGASGLGWEVQEDFDNFVDPPATLESVSAKALASHPSRSLFLVGSSNTHIYLWEFGKDKAAATYGVLPAANVPPPYALASVTALKFDCYGHRFANSASDGTVCTWQLEVGGRSNVRPAESSLCFNGHASDVCYVATSGSIIAVAGYNPNGVNVVIWDTLAPPATSRASVMCHEGGASSIAVFDNDVGSGSISPFIVTGGKGGDVGLHDFRYIATGKTKRHRHSNTGERISDASAVHVPSGLSNSMGDQNRNGMLWYIPKAHSGSITKISTIPNTSLVLTGSKDGDVKLWDVRRASLVFHWPKLHERHTFLQRGSQGFGGVARVAVTDIEVVSNGFLTCGGDGSVKLVQLKDFASETWKS